MVLARPDGFALLDLETGLEELFAQPPLDARTNRFNAARSIGQDGSGRARSTTATSRASDRSTGWAVIGLFVYYLYSRSHVGRGLIEVHEEDTDAPPQPVPPI